jgi:thioredoxin reductase (NADPH)
LKRYDIAIIGAGPTGLFACFQAGMLGLNTCIIDTLNFVGGQCSALYAEKPIYDIPGFHIINAAQLIEELKKQVAPFNPKFILGEHCLNIKKEEENFQMQLETSTITAKTVIIAAGAGSFEPRKPPFKGIDDYENNSVFYHITNKEMFRDKVVTIAGGGDSALDWAVLLANDVAKKVYIVHRRNSFRAVPKTVEKINTLCDSKKIEIIAPYQLDGLEGDGTKLRAINVIDLDGNALSFESDYLLPFFGMHMDIGPIANWGLHIKNKHVAVAPATMQTNVDGIFAIGDICDYPGKLKLILTGFAEGARACHSAYELINPDVPLHFEHSTTKGLPSSK